MEKLNAWKMRQKVFKNVNLKSAPAPDCHEKHKKRINHFIKQPLLLEAKENINIVEKKSINIFIYFISA